MNKNLKRLIAIVLTIALMAGFAIPTFASAADLSSVGALWDSYEAGTGTFTVTSTSRVYVVGTSAPTGDLLQTAQLIQRELRAQFESVSGAFDELVWGPADWAATGDIVLSLDSSSGTGADGYKLDVTATTATITAADTDGLIYGANNLIKCFRAVDGDSISCFNGADAPDTKQRVVMLDTGRKYYTVEWIKNFIRQMSWMGYNALELHFSEDGGFRADLWDPAYYKGEFQPVNDFTWLCGSHVQSWVKDPYRDDPDAGKYLTTAELVEICEVAKEYHIEIIPSFDSPAHMDYITWKFEQNYKSNNNYYFSYDGKDWFASATNGCINYRGTTGASSPTWPNYTTININSDSNDEIANMAKAFVFALYEDMADFFKEYAGSTNFSIGADEVNLSSSACKWDYSDFPVYINSLNKLLNSKGYTVRMFNDFIGSTVYNKSSDNKAVYEFDKNIEIMYWNSDFNPTTGKWGETDNTTWHVKFFWENNDGTTDNWGDGGRTMYNCIQTNCYYVLRVAASGTGYDNMDARNPENYNWSFYDSNEENIYNDWYPADISERGLYTEDAADVPAANLGGAYFLIWNDYASLNTEAEVWNDVKDNTGTSSYVYSLFDRMASNIIKMWNSDIDDSLTYSKFAAVRDTFGYFPGFTSCSADASLPAATSPSAAEEPYAADHSELEAALAAKKTEQGNYTDESWANYLSAIAAAEEVHADRSATEQELAAAVKSIKEAEAALEEKVVLDTSKLNEAIEKANAITEQGDYTTDSWNTFVSARDKANAFKVTETTTQDEIDAMTAELEAAINGLTDGKEVTIHEVEVLNRNNTVRIGKKIGLRITSQAGANDPVFQIGGKTVEPSLCVGKDQTLTNYEEDVKVWLIYLPTTDLSSGENRVTIQMGSTVETVTVTVK